MKTREEWLLAAIEKLRVVFDGNNIKLPEKIKVSCSWASSRSRVTLGQIYHQTSDGIPQIFISPTLEERSKVLAVLMHELLHAAFPGEGHQGLFAKHAPLVGFQIPLTKSVVNESTERGLAKIGVALGEYPHAGIDPNEIKKQKTRMLKIVCPNKCGNHARVSNLMYRSHELFCGCEIEDNIVNKMKLESEV